MGKRAPLDHTSTPDTVNNLDNPYLIGMMAEADKMYQTISGHWRALKGKEKAFGHTVVNTRSCGHST